MPLSFFKPIACASFLVLPIITHAAEETLLEEVVVTATLRPQTLQDVPSSVTVLDSQTLKDAGQQHFQDVLGLVPNLNASGTTSRPRYFQLRGIGEYDSFGIVFNPSVGFLIDDMDFTGVGMPATLFDMKQVEVLRGPQGTRYGANALAGLIAMRSNDPSKEAQANVEASVGNYNTRSLGAAVSAPVESIDSGWRLAVQQYQSDGFMMNSYLDRKDTNGRDELTARFKWHSDLNDATTLDFTLLHANLDNGYDAWTTYNTRTSLSDKPGEDLQRTTGGSVKINSRLSNDLLMTSVLSIVNSDLVNNYDGDWGNNQNWQNVMNDPMFSKDEVGSDVRSRETRSLDFRIASGSEKDAVNWLLGAYGFTMREHMNGAYHGIYTGGSTWDQIVESSYKANNLSIYSQLDGYIASRWSWSTGLRGEWHAASYDYQSDNNPPLHPENTSENMWGGQASLGFDLSDNKNLYFSVSRGYKAGGFNTDPQAADINKTAFGQETLLNYELGTKGTAFQDRVYFDATIFYEQRDNVQIKNGQQKDPNNSNSYVEFIDNVGSGFNTGVETSFRIKLTSAIEAGGSLGLLQSKTGDYTYYDTAIGSLVFVPSRDLAYAPRYNTNLYGLWRSFVGFMARVDVQAKDRFYVDSTKPGETKAYTVTNIKLGYEQPKWDAYLWVMNVFDADYAVHGFVFNNNPVDPNQNLYFQKGDPRQIGVTGSWKF